MAHGDARDGNWRGNWQMEWVASTLHTTSEHGVSSITTADAHTSAVSSRMHWPVCRFKWTSPFRRKTKSGFCACAITVQPASTVKTLRPTGCSSYCYVVQLSFCVSHFYFMTSVFHFSYFNTGYNYYYTCNNCNDQIFYNLK